MHLFYLFFQKEILNKNKFTCGRFALSNKIMTFLSLVNKYYVLIASVYKAKEMNIIPVKLCFCDLDIDVLKVTYFPLHSKQIQC